MRVLASSWPHMYLSMVLQVLQHNDTIRGSCDTWQHLRIKEETSSIVCSHHSLLAILTEVSGSDQSRTCIQSEVIWSHTIKYDHVISCQSMHWYCGSEGITSHHHWSFWYFVQIHSNVPQSCQNKNHLLNLHCIYITWLKMHVRIAVF